MRKLKGIFHGTNTKPADFEVTYTSGKTLKVKTLTVAATDERSAIEKAFEMDAPAPDNRFLSVHLIRG